MNILIIEDDCLLANRIKDVFEKIIITNRIKILNSYEDFLKESSYLKHYNVILTDIKIGKDFCKTWMDVIKIIRNKKINVPIVVISCLWDLHWLENAFSLWANDYLIKPFRLKELQIRIIRWFKIYYTSLRFWNNNKIAYKELVYDLDSNNFYFKWSVIDFGKRSKYILSLFLSSPETLITEMELVEKIWWDEYITSNRNVRVNILRLKTALKPFLIDDWIENVRWEGYILKG